MACRSHRRFLATGLLLTACGGYGTSPPPPPPPPGPVIAAGNPSGDGQIGLPSAVLGSPLRVQVTQGGAPVAGRAVDWGVQKGGSVNPTQSSTGADGVATTVVTLGNEPVMTIRASSGDATGGPIVLTALAAGPTARVEVLGPPENKFDPKTVAIRAGGTVTFEWPSGSNSHNLIPDDGKDRPNDPIVRNGPFTVEVTFPTAGDYFYHCSVHGSARSGMFGKVVVVP